MAMSLELPQDPDVRFAVSPLVELGWAWHVLVGAGHHPERAAWAARVREDLPAELLAALEHWSFAVRAVRAIPLVDPTLQPATRWDILLAQLGVPPAEDFAAALLRPLLRSRGRSANLADARVRAGIVGLARARGRETVRVVRLLMDDPESAREAFVDLLAASWTAFFRPEWERVEADLSREVERRTRLCVRDGWPAAVRSLSPAVTVADGRIAIDKVQSKRIATAGRGVVFVPTVFGAPHVYVGDEAGRPVVVHYPYPAPDRAAEVRLSLRRLAVLANPARLEVCRAIAVEPRSAVEIARLWGFAESAVTKHLSVLRAAGLVRAERVGHFVRYSLEGSVIELLGGDLLEVLRR